MDFAILDFIQNLRCDVLDEIFAVITHLGDGGAVWIVIGIAMLFSKKYRKSGVMMLVSLALCAVLTNVVIKPVVARTRPFLQAGIEPYIAPPGGYSFPSGHTSASFASAFSLFFNHKKEGYFAFAAATLIAFSRLYFYVHFPTDVIAGVVVGLACSLIVKYGDYKTQL